MEGRPVSRRGKEFVVPLGPLKLDWRRLFHLWSTGHQRDPMGCEEKILELLRLCKILILLNFHLYVYFTMYIV